MNKYFLAPILLISALVFSSTTQNANAYDWVANDPDYSCYHKKDNWWGSTRYCHKINFRIPNSDKRSWDQINRICKFRGGTLVWDRDQKTCRTTEPTTLR
jgi:hypothetical protein